MLRPVLASPQVLTASQWPATVEITCLISADPLLTPAFNAEAILEREWTLMLHCDGHVTCVRGMKPSCLHPADGCSGEFWATFRAKIPCQKPGVISLTIVPDKLLAKQSSPTGSCCCSSSATATSSDSWHCCQSVQLFVSPNAAVTNELQDMFAAMQGVITAQQQQRKQQQQMLLSSSSFLQSDNRQQLPAPWHPLQEQQQQQGLLHTSNGANQSWAAADGAFAACPAPYKNAFMNCDLLDASQEQLLPFAAATATAKARRCSCSCSCVAAELAASDVFSGSSSSIAAAAVATWLGHFQPLLADMQTVFRYIANVSNPDGCINSSSHENSNSCSSHSSKSSGCSRTAPDCGLPTAAETALISSLDTPADAVGHVFISLLEFLAMHECWCSVSYILAQAFSSGLLSDADVVSAVVSAREQQQPYAASAVVASLIASLTSSSSNSMSEVEMS